VVVDDDNWGERKKGKEKRDGRDGLKRGRKLG